MANEKKSSNATLPRPGLQPRALSRDQGELVLAAEIEVDLSSSSLFYPCAGRDWSVPIQLFLRYVSSFWFVDINYREEEISRIRYLRSTRAQLIESRIELYEEAAADMGGRRAQFEQHPFVRTVDFSGREARERFTVRWCGHDGASVLRMLDEPIGVFFYRGDSCEGGSAMPWLCRPDSEAGGQMDCILAQLADGGLIVTDGSNGPEPWESAEYGQLSRLYLDYDADPARACEQVEEFRDSIGNHFRCIGYVQSDRRFKGPTLVWQVRKPERLDGPNGAGF